MTARAATLRAALALAIAHTAAAAGGGPAWADPVERPPPDLTVRSLPVPVPTSLAMRQEVVAAQAVSAPGAAPSPPPTSKDTGTVRAGDARARRDALAPGKRLDEKIIFRFNIGFGMDGGQPSGEPPLSGGQLAGRYDVLRTYGFGDVVLGTRGLLVPSLGTYFAADFRLDQNLPHVGESTGAVPSVYYHTDDNNEMLIRHGYAEAEGVFDRPWLKPLYLRAGRQFKYGVTVAHFDGATVGYETRTVSVSFWGGKRVSLYGLDRRLDNELAPAISGSSVRVDLFELRRIPLVLTTDTLHFEDIDHVEYGLAFRWSQDMLIRASVRRLDGNFARQTLATWARLSEVTTLNVEIDNRTGDDWMYDLMAMRPVDQRGDPRSYLNLGPMLPRTQLDLRAGTVLLRNLDILVRGAAAIEHADGEVDAPFSPSYFEAGAALEVRLRRNLRLGSTFSARRYRRDDAPPLLEQPGPLPDRLPVLQDQIGEKSFYEGGLGVDYTAGARRFNASAELYSRAYNHQTPYQEIDIAGYDVHSGGRFAVEGWAQSRIRIKAEYDVSLGSLQLAPELRGVKMLRVLTEGTF